MKSVTLLLSLWFLFGLLPQAQASSPAESSSDSLLTIVLAPDSSSFLCDSLSNLLSSFRPLKVRFIFKNDHRWNNWAIDTTLHDKLTQNDLQQLFTQRPTFRQNFQPINLHFNNQNSDQRFKKYLKPGLAGFALLTNWSSFYFKRLADDYYQRYHHTSDISRLNTYYNKTQQYDQISNILLTVSVVSLSVYLYLLLH